MSQPNPSDSKELPNAILVQPTIYARRVKKARNGAWRERLPWNKILIGGCIAWVAGTLFVGLYALMSPGMEPIDLEDEPLPPLPGKVAFREPREEPDQPAMPKERNGPEVAAPKKWAPKDFVECARIGTDVQFMKDPTEAFRRARAEKKMVFMVHLSGNLEDQEFT